MVVKIREASCHSISIEAEVIVPHKHITPMRNLGVATKNVARQIQVFERTSNKTPSRNYLIVNCCGVFLSIKLHCSLPDIDIDSFKDFSLVGYILSFGISLLYLLLPVACNKDSAGKVFLSCEQWLLLMDNLDSVPSDI